MGHLYHGDVSHNQRVKSTRVNSWYLVPECELWGIDSIPYTQQSHCIPASAPSVWWSHHRSPGRRQATAEHPRKRARLLSWKSIVGNHLTISHLSGPPKVVIKSLNVIKGNKENDLQMINFCCNLINFSANVSNKTMTNSWLPRGTCHASARALGICPWNHRVLWKQMNTKKDHWPSEIWFKITTNISFISSWNPPSFRQVSRKTWRFSSFSVIHMNRRTSVWKSPTKKEEFHSEQHEI